MKDNKEMIEVTRVKWNPFTQRESSKKFWFQNYPRKPLIDWIEQQTGHNLHSIERTISKIIKPKAYSSYSEEDQTSKLSISRFIKSRFDENVKFTFQVIYIKESELMNMTNWELMERWKLINPTVKVVNKKEKRPFPSDPISQKIFEVFWKKYQPLIRNLSSFMVKHLIQKNFEFEDCSNEIAECLKNVLLWFDENSFTGDKEKFSISYYLNDQVTARTNAMNKTHCEYSYQKIRYKKFTEQEITSEEQMEVIETLHCKSYQSEWDEKLEIDNFVKSLSEIEQKVFKLCMVNVSIPTAHKELGIPRNKFLKLVREVSSKAVSYNRSK